MTIFIPIWLLWVLGALWLAPGTLAYYVFVVGYWQYTSWKDRVQAFVVIPCAPLMILYRGLSS